MTDWVTDLLAGRPGCERELVERYTAGLLAVARRQLPLRLSARVDAEDVVQSVYRSFFRRLNAGQFAFDDTHDLWRLLTVMTFHKARNAVKFHSRDRRDVRRELAPEGYPPLAQRDAGAVEPEDVEVLFGYLEALLANLPEHYRAIVLRRLDGESIEQISRAVDRTQRTVLRVLARVREKLVSELDTTP